VGNQRYTRFRICICTCKLKSEFDWFLSDKFKELKGCKEKSTPREPLKGCKEKSTPREPFIDEPAIEKKGYKEKIPPRTPPLFLYDHHINKKLNLERFFTTK
jgi:hypothetical protein